MSSTATTWSMSIMSTILRWSGDVYLIIDWVGFTFILFLIIIFTKWEYQPKECSGPSAHSRENLLEIFVHILLSLPQKIHSCESCMCFSLCQLLCQKRWTPRHRLLASLDRKRVNTYISFCAKKRWTPRDILLAGLDKKGWTQTDTQTDRQVSPLYSSEIYFCTYKNK